MNAPLSFDVYSELIRMPPSLLAREESAPAYGRGQGLSATPEAARDWSVVHARIVELGTERAAHERELCRWLLAAERLGVPTRAGFASLREYADRTVGLNGRQTEERLRVGRALASLPTLDQALATGALSWSAVRELTRVATAETEEEWVAWAEGKTSRQVERAVAARHRGDSPDDRGDSTLVKHKLSFEVRAETMAMFRDLQATVRSELGGDVDDDALLYEVARRALGGPDDDGRASYQVAVTRCEDCGRTSVDAAGESHLVDEVVAEMAVCDGQHIGRVDGGDDGPHTPAGALVSEEGHVRGAPPAPSLGPSPHAGAQRSTAAQRAKRARATQTVPPAIRRRVLRRDRRRCIVPGCRNHRFLDVHHLDPRAEGGGHDPERLAVLCGAHHRSVHLGHLCVDGTGSAGFVVHHGDGTPYGGALSPARLDLAELALGALRNMGFKVTQARKLVDTVLSMDVVPDEPGEFVRAALRAT